MNADDLRNPELQEKLKACQNADELVALAEEAGMNLSREQLEAVAGGGWSCDDACPTNCIIQN